MHKTNWRVIIKLKQWIHELDSFFPWKDHLTTLMGNKTHWNIFNLKGGWRDGIGMKSPALHVDPAQSPAPHTILLTLLEWFTEHRTMSKAWAPLDVAQKAKHNTQNKSWLFSHEFSRTEMQESLCPTVENECCARDALLQSLGPQPWWQRSQTRLQYTGNHTCSASDHNGCARGHTLWCRMVPGSKLMATCMQAGAGSLRHTSGHTIINFFLHKVFW